MHFVQALEQKAIISQNSTEALRVYYVLWPQIFHDKWVPVTTAWHVLRLRMEERPPIWRVAANILNKQSRTAGKQRSSSFGVGRSANNSSPKNWLRYETDTIVLALD